MALYIQENLIEKIEGLDFLPVLHSLNLSDNMLTKVEGLERLTKLETIQLKRNRFGKNLDDVNDLLGLLECPSISVLDISDNYIQDEKVLEEVIYKMPNLAVLYMHGNPFTKKIKNYRKTVISSIPTLKYLDDRPVFKDDRRYAEAFARGGLDEERKEREVYKKEEADKHWANHEAFSEMIRKAREEKRLAEEAKKALEQPPIEELKDAQDPELESAPELSENLAVEVLTTEQTIVQLEQSREEVQEEEDLPELEEVDIQEERMKQILEIEQKKKLEQEKWLESTKARSDDEAFIPWDEECALPAPDEQAIAKRQQHLESLQNTESVQLESVPEPAPVNEETV